MNEQFTQEELRNIAVLINIATIKGEQAVTVALLQQKLGKLLNPSPNPIQNLPQEEKPAESEK